MRTIFKYRVLFGATVFCIVGLLFIIYYLNRDKIQSKSDLVEISANMKDYSFAENRSIRRHTFQYYVFLHGFNNRFQIIADFVPLFNKEAFEQNIQSYEIITVYISKKDFRSLNKRYNVRVFGINSSRTAYLDIEPAMKIRTIY